MEKLIIGIIIVVFTTLCGYLLAKKYRKRKLFFKELSEFNERFLSEISYYRRPIKEFAFKYAYKGEFANLLQDYFEGIEDRALEEKSLLDEPVYSFLKAEEKQVVEDYFLMLGKGDSASQKGYFSSVKNGLLTLKTNAETACKKYGDLYVKLGFLCGLLILILIV